MRIFLVGYMGSGKSTIGRALAVKLDMPFVDSDTYIETQTGLSIKDIFDLEGETYFRQLEHEAINDIVGSKQHAVIATGGGLPCVGTMMDRISEAGETVYLKVSIDTIIDRIHTSDNRPIFDTFDKTSLRQHIAKHLASRRPYYRQANIIVWNRGAIDAVVQRIIDKLNI